MKLLDLFKDFRIKRDNVHYTPFDTVKADTGSYREFSDKMETDSLIMLIVGKRGSGKTSLGMKFLEFFHMKTKRKCYVLGYGNTRLPWWIKKVESLDRIPNNAVALFDEGAVLFSARDPMRNINKELSRIMSIARHKNLTLFLITQNSAMIDLNVLRLADTLLIKEPSLLQSKFERKALKDIFEKVKPEFEKLGEKKSHFYVWDDDFQGLVHYHLPDFWNDKISKSFGDIRLQR
jgi:hypothetical protein